MLLHRMTLISFRMFLKNLRNLREFFEQIVYRPPGEKLPVCLWEKREQKRKFPVSSEERREVLIKIHKNL